MEPIDIKPAQVSDAEACLALTKRLTLGEEGSEESGFLSGKDSLEEFRLYLADNRSFLICDSGELAAFLIAQEKGSEAFRHATNFLKQAEFYDTDVRKIEKLIYVNMIGVAPRFQHQGLGTALYRQLFECFSDHCFLTRIISEPRKNAPSEKLHLKLGFSPCGEISKGEYVGYESFKLILYLR